MIMRQALLAAVILIPIAAKAETIELDPDVYWQVQNSATYNTLCEGFVTQCEVNPGIYNIINLTSGERQQGVVVAPDNQQDQGRLEVVSKVCDWTELDWTPIPEEDRPFSYSGALYCDVSCPAGKILVSTIECSLETGDVISDNLEPLYEPTVLRADVSGATCRSAAPLHPPLYPSESYAYYLQTKVTIACQ